VLYGVISGKEDDCSMPIHTHDGDEGSGGKIVDADIDITDTNSKFISTTLGGVFDEIGETKFWNGFDLQSPDSNGTLTWDSGTRTVSLAVTGGESNFYFWVDGKKVTKTTTQTVVVPDVTGVYYCYFDTSGVLQYILDSSVPDSAFYDCAIVAIVRWNATQGTGGCGNERHGIRMSGATHLYNHVTYGARYEAGFDITGLTDGSPTYTQVASGKFWDEDIRHSLSAQSTHPWMYRLGASGLWTSVAADNQVGLKDGADTYYSWNEWTGSTWQLTEGTTTTDYFISFFIATPSVSASSGVMKIVGHNAYSSVANARAAIESELHGLSTEGLPGPEIVFLLAIIVDRTGDLQELADGSVYYDLRGVSSKGSGGSSGTTLSAADVPITDSGSIITADNVEDALQENRTAIDLNTDQFSAIDALVASVDAVAVYYGKVADDDDPEWYLKEGGDLWPAEYLCYAVGDTITVKDVTDIELPTFTTYTYTGYVISSVKMLNGMLVVGTDLGLFVENIMTGLQEFYDSSTDIDLVDDVVNDVVLTRLSTAPVDPSTNQRYSTIACATNGGGGSWILDDTETVIDATGAIALISCGINSNGMTIWASSTKLYIFNTTPITDTALTSADYIFDTAGASGPHISGTIKTVKLEGTNIKVGTDEGLFLISYNPTTPAESGVTQIEGGFSTGVQRGDIQLATMCDTVAGAISDTELVTNGTFDSDTTGWIASNSAVLSIDTQRLKIFNGDSLYGRAHQIFNTTIGKTYIAILDFTKSTSVGCYLNIKNVSGTTLGTTLETSGLVTSSQEIRVPFIAITSTQAIQISNGSSVSDEYGFFDNISVTEAIPDRSVQGNHATITGTLTRTAVATGAELVSFGGFSASDYATIPYSSDFDFGTGPAHISLWLTGSSDIYGNYIINRQNDAGTFSFALYAHGDSPHFIQLYVKDASGDTVTEFEVDYSVPKFKLDLVRDTTTSFRLYIDGSLVGVASSAISMTDSDANAEVGIGIGTGNHLGYYPWEGEIALLRIAAIATTAEQIKADYLEELPMFQENAKVTLSGSSNSVLALDYDKTTENVTVLTDVVDTFNGLINVEQATLTGTGQCVSVGGGATLIGTSSQVDFEKPEINLREELSQVPQNATNLQKGLATAKHITDIETNNDKISFDSTSSTKLGTIEESADVTDATNVIAAGAIMKLKTLTAGESLVDGDLCYLKSDGKMWKTSRSATTTIAGFLAICTETISADGTGDFLHAGIYTTTGLTVSNILFVDTMSGDWTGTKPSTTGDLVRIIGYSLSTTELYFNPDGLYFEIG